MRVLIVIFLLTSPLSSICQSLFATQHMGMDHGLLQNTVWTIEEDYAHRLWFGSPSGVQYYNGFKLQTFKEISETVTTLHHHDSSMYAVSTIGIHKINEKNLTVLSFPFKYTDYYSVSFLDSSIIVNDSEGNTILYLDYNLERVAPFPFKKKNKTDFTFQLGDFSFHGNENGIYTKHPDSTIITQSYTTSFLKYNSNRAFIASHEGLIELQIRKNQPLKITNHFATYRVEAIHQDRNKNLWIGTAENGVFMIHRNTLMSTFYSKNNPKKEPLTCWSFINLDSTLFVATNNGISPVFSNSPSNIQLTTQTLSCFSGNGNQNVTLIGTSKNGIYTLKNGTLHQSYYNSIQTLDNTILQIVKNEKGFLACSKKSFIQLDSNGNFLFSEPYSFTPNNTYTMFLTSTDYGYLASTTSGICKLDHHLKIINQYKNDHARVVSMTTQFQDQTWLTTMDAGLLYLENDSLHSVHFPDRQLLTLTPYKNESLWISSVTSIYHYTPESNYIRPFHVENGFPLKEYNQLSHFKDSQNNLYYAGIGGVLKFHPDSLYSFPNFPEILVTRDHIHLSSEQPEILNFDQSELNLFIEPILTSDHNYFKTEILFNEIRIEISEPQQISIPIPYKTSELQIITTDLIHHKTVINTFPIYRELPIWMKLWFKALLILAILLLIIGIYSFIEFYKTKKLLKKEQETKKITEERLRISKELHDNIGARITHIISSLDIEMYKNETSTSIESINSFARETMLQLRETIWAVSDKTIFFSEFVLRVGQYITQINEMTSIKITCHIDVDSDFELNPVQTINYYRIIQEAINNAIKHAFPSKIQVNISEQNKTILIRIADNGTGFKVEQKNMGSGIENMKTRANESAAHFNIRSTEDGTIIIVKINR